MFGMNSGDNDTLHIHLNFSSHAHNIGAIRS